MRNLPARDASPKKSSSNALINRWRISQEGGIESDRNLLTGGDAHRDHLEVGGRSVNAIIVWSVSREGLVSVERLVRWPTVREVKDDTHGSFSHFFNSTEDCLPLVENQTYVPGPATRFWINGFFSWEETGKGLTVRRTLYPSHHLPCLFEKWEIRNTGSEPCSIRIPEESRDLPRPRELFKWSAHILRSEWIGKGLRVLAPGESMSTGMVFSCREENAAPFHPDLLAEWTARQFYRDSLFEKLALHTPSPAINRFFELAKLRTAENVLATRGGLLHAPGGFSSFLASIWCNDQNEYVNPFSPFLGDAAGDEAASNAYRWFASYRNEAFKPIPSSIIAEGRGNWSDAGDRGDAAMTAYGAARWALATGDASASRELWPFIQWCLEFCDRQKNAQGLIESDSDELENRFSAGRTNLATSCLAYDATISAAYLASALGEAPEVTKNYQEKAAALAVAIETHFGATIQGYETYRYHENLEKLRAWICLPLTMGITDRAAETVAALFSDQLWTADGLLTEAGTSTRWDRSTLYALRGIFIAGFPDEASKRLESFVTKRLLGDHVPYCVEAFPEANESQLSAESALFCRVITEGICGIRPVGFSEFECTPQLPKEWPGLVLKKIHGFARVWDLEVTRHDHGLQVTVTLADGRKCYCESKPEGATHRIHLSSPRISL